MAFATVVAIVLRQDFDSLEDKIITLVPYVLISLGCASVVFFVGGLDRTPWQYSTVADHLQIIVLTVLAILLALVLTFTANRLVGVARSLPAIQGALIITVLVFARGAARLWYARKIHAEGNGRVISGQPRETVLVVGVNAVSELFILSVQELASRQVDVAGILTEEPRMRGRAIQQKPILGTVEELLQVLQSLEVHGTSVNRIVVAIAADRLPHRALETLLEVEKSSDIDVQFLSERLGLEDSSEGLPALSERQRDSVVAKRGLAPVGSIGDVGHADSTKSFQLVKRIVDVFGAAFLMVTLTPVVILVAFIVAWDVGFPVIFWQQRPGLYGRPFKLYKFRTMRAPHDKHKKQIADDQRSSAVGQIVRRTRVDELPQLYNVLVGDMSLIGPRPLLPRDQSPDYAARLSMRPGITGWAQVNGGRIISSSDKWLLDLWYVQNASFVLDLKITLSTVKMVLFGDRLNAQAVDRARSDVDLKTQLRTEMIAAE